MDNARSLRGLANILPMDQRHKELLKSSADEIEGLREALKKYEDAYELVEIDISDTAKGDE